MAPFSSRRPARSRPIRRAGDGEYLANKALTLEAQWIYHPRVAAVYRQILETLSARELSVEELLKEAADDAQRAKAAELRAAILPLILTGRIELTRGRKMRIPRLPGR